MHAESPDLFERPAIEPIVPGALLLHGEAADDEVQLLADLAAVISAVPLRHLITPGGYRMSVAMSNCGSLGWVSDETGYRYSTIDPASGEPWPVMPDSFRALATRAAARAGFEGFEPDACLINRYVPGARLTLHQDRDERDKRHPIVSVSLGLPAVFLFGGLKRNERARRVPLVHGDVVVWGGPARLAYHGVLPLAEPLRQGGHPLTGACRFNLTLRRAG